MAAQDTQAIFRAAEAGDPQAAAIVDEAVNYLTIMVANAVAMIDPDRIVIGGGVAQTSLGLSARIEEKLTYLLPAKPSLWHWELGAYASVKGAATLVLDGLLNDTLTQERESSQD
jgi:glucokinase